MCYYSINYTITSTFSDDGFVTDAKTTPTLFESLQKMTEDCTEGLLPVPFLVQCTLFDQKLLTDLPQSTLSFRCNWSTNKRFSLLECSV